MEIKYSGIRRDSKVYSVWADETTKVAEFIGPRHESQWYNKPYALYILFGIPSDPFPVYSGHYQEMEDALQLLRIIM